MNARVVESSGWPGERNTSGTIGGTEEWFLPIVPPQAHLRCSSGCVATDPEVLDAIAATP
jgi:hypothetical protein